MNAFNEQFPGILKAYLNDTCYTLDNSECNELSKFVQNLIDALEAVPNWIAVEEGLPPPVTVPERVSFEVLCWDGTHCEVGRYDWNLDIWHTSKIKPTHWKHIFSE